MPKPAVVRFAIATLAAALLLAACSDRVPPPETPTPTHPPRPTATPSPVRSPLPEVPDFLRGVDVRPLRIDRDAGLTNMTNLFIELGCTQCDGPTTGFARVYGTFYSEARFDVLLTPEMLPLPPATPEDQRYIAGFGFAPDGSDLIAGVCVHGYCGGMGGPTANAEVWLFRSTDGGITWSDFEHLPRAEIIIGWLGPGSVLTSAYDDASGRFSYAVRPTGEGVEPPRGHAGAWPSVTSDGQLLWHDAEGLIVDDDSHVYVGTEQSGVSFGNPLTGSRSDLVPLFWQDTKKYYLAQLESDGSVRRAFTADGWINPGAWMSPVSDARIFASLPVPASRYPATSGGQFVGSLPAIVDLGSAAVLPIPHPFLDDPFFNGRNHVVAVQQGPLVRVKDTGDCLNVRDAPSTAASVLTCAADNVLLRDQGETAEADGITWARVVTPAGAEGWAAAQYLER